MKPPQQSKDFPVLAAIGFLPVVFVSAGLICLHNLLVTFLLYHVVVCILIPFAYGKLNGAGPAGMKPEKGWAIASVFTGLALGAFFFAATFVFFKVFSNAVISREHVNTVLALWGVRRAYLPELFAYFVIFNSVVEEMFWRGFFIGKISGGNNRASVITSLFFMQYHFVTVWLIFSFNTALLFTPVIFIVSYIWGRLRLYFKDIYAPVISHLLADLALIYVLYRYVLYP